MEAEKDKDIALDTLEVLLNPGLIKSKACFFSGFDQKSVYNDNLLEGLCV
jgi:hypothetical protein